MTGGYSPAAHLALGRTDFTIFDDRRCAVGESPLWDPASRRLFWVDVPGQRILGRGIDGDAPSSWSFDAPVSSIALSAEGLIACIGSQIVELDLDGRQRATIAAIGPAREGLRINECKVDRDGRLWAATIDAPRWEADGILYAIGDDGAAAPRVGGLSVANGMAWSLDGTRMYLADSPTRRIDHFDFDRSTGAATRRRTFARLDEGMVDGAVVDGADHLWCATPGAWCITRFAPSGAIERRLRLPIRFPTACAFGGDACDILFVTSAVRPLSEDEQAQQPAAGCVIAIPVGGGLAEPRALSGYSFRSVPDRAALPGERPGASKAGVDFRA